MEKPTVKIPSHLSLIVLLSSGLTLAVSTIYTVLSILVIVYRYQCPADTNVTGSDIFMNTLYRVYILQDECDYSISRDGLTEAKSVFLMMIITLVISVLCVISACSLIAVVKDDGASRYLHLVAYIYIGACLASLVVDITLATHFGMDYSTLARAMDQEPATGESMYKLDTMRLGAVLLMSLSLKGYMAPALNIVFLILMVIYMREFKKLQQKNQHPIHKLGALHAFEPRRKPEDTNWPSQPDMFLSPPGTRGPQINPTFINDDDPPRSPFHEQQSKIPQYANNRLTERSESWQPGPMSGSRPFSYLEEARRPVPVRPPTSPAEPQWRREWPPPPVPAPDYSPQAPRRLKSALKHSY